MTHLCNISRHHVNSYTDIIQTEVFKWVYEMKNFNVDIYRELVTENYFSTFTTRKTGFYYRNVKYLKYQPTIC